ncbi:hypothetical protein [Treponema denticola]|uniref:Zinc-finger domain-containing protein n=1 Tax=Treponema denticola SP33 TaxID=999437 RepID=M2BHE8_TREDN|nr:hypothetical protein [Treponema denticola]EMB24447.1 hypothetical protein HMPREF9733_01399 [Treponema denticola SP33]EPF37903.1 hypothetical protein HMPREF9732_00497 [Treponema denticola SP32]
MTCNEAINRYMMLDKHEAVPFAVTFHLLRCKKCRSIVRALTQASNLYTSSFQTKADDALTEKTMVKIHAAIPDLLNLQAEKYRLTNVSILPWAVVGILMIVGLACIPFTAIGKWAAENFKLSFVIPFGLVFAVFVSVYSAIFVYRNLDFFVKKFDLKKEKA